MYLADGSLARGVIVFRILESGGSRGLELGPRLVSSGGARWTRLVSSGLVWGDEVDSWLIR